MTTLDRDLTAFRRLGQPPASGAREAPFVQALRDIRDAAPDHGDGLTLDGYGAVFGQETLIDSYEGRFMETILPGSMKRSFREAPPRIQFDHGRHPLIGSIPIAKLERAAEESDPELAPDGGAHIIGRVFDNWLTAPLRDAIAAGAVDGMSFRFEVIREAWQDYQGNKLEGDALMNELRRTWDYSVPDEELPLRQLKELRVPEMGPVVWPAYKQTSVGMRSQVIDLGRLNEPETRRMLATAVFLADAAEQKTDAQPSTRAERVAGPPPHSDAQPDTRDESRADEHPSNPIDAQQVTAPSAVGEHPSTPPASSSEPVRGRRDIDIFLRRVRDTMLDCNRKGNHYDRPVPQRRIDFGTRRAAR